MCSPMDDAGFPVKAEEFVVLSQEPSVTETIAPKIARPFIEVRTDGACPDAMGAATCLGPNPVSGRLWAPLGPPLLGGLWGCIIIIVVLVVVLLVVMRLRPFLAQDSPLPLPFLKTSFRVLRSNQCRCCSSRVYSEVRLPRRPHSHCLATSCLLWGACSVPGPWNRNVSFLFWEAQRPTCSFKVGAICTRLEKRLRQHERTVGTIEFVPDVAVEHC